MSIAATLVLDRNEGRRVTGDNIYTLTAAGTGVASYFPHRSNCFFVLLLLLLRYRLCKDESAK